MQRFLKPRAGIANSGGASSSHAPEPREDSGPSGGGGAGRSSSAAEPGDEASVDLEVSSNSSGEMVEAGALPEGLDISWAQPAQSWQLARWCVARAHSVVRAVAKVMSIANASKDKEGQKAAGKLHVRLRAGGKGQPWLPSAQVRENATEKAHAVLGALRQRTEVMDDKAERTLSALAVCDAPRAQELYQLGLRVQDPTISEKSFRRVQTA